MSYLRPINNLPKTQNVVRTMKKSGYREKNVNYTQTIRKIFTSIEYQLIPLSTYYRDGI